MRVLSFSLLAATASAFSPLAPLRSLARLTSRNAVPKLTDTTVSLSPYFKVKDVPKFKHIWKEAYDPFAHKEDCVHYAFTFETAEDGSVRAHCREAYTSADTVLQHLADVDAPLNLCLEESAELERLEVHGPEAEIEKLKDPLTPFGCAFFVAEWGFRPSAPQEVDTVCHLYPYFTMKDSKKFKKIWGDAYAATEKAAKEEKSAQYAFVFDGDTAMCREAYMDAEGVLKHLENVDTPLNAVLAPEVAELLRLELHAPASEIEKLKPALGPLGCQFFEVEWGFRN